jgi:hypothetical protein
VPERAAARVRETEAVLARLFEHDDELERGQAAAAVLGGGIQAPQSRRASLGAKPRQPVIRDARGLGTDLPLHDAQPFRDELRRQIPHHAELVRKVEPVERHCAHLSASEGLGVTPVRSDN